MPTIHDMYWGMQEPDCIDLMLRVNKNIIAKARRTFIHHDEIIVKI